MQGILTEKTERSLCRNKRTVCVHRRKWYLIVTEHMVLPNVFAFFILRLLPLITLTASEKLFQATFEAFVLLAVLCASLLPQTVEFFSRKLSNQVIGDYSAESQTAT